MKSLIITLSLNICAIISAFAQQPAKVTITAPNFKGIISVIDPSAKYVPGHGIGSGSIGLNAQYTGFYTTAPLKQAQYIKIYMYNNSAYYLANLWVSPGDDLTFKILLAQKPYAITVTGKGSNNNQPEIFALTNFYTQPYRNDHAPGRFVLALNKQARLNKSILANYIKRYQLSPAFAKVSQQNLTYFAPSIYYECFHNEHNADGDRLSPWQRIEDSLLTTVKLNNDEAMASCNYKRLIDDFMLREKENLMMESAERPAQFFKTWYHTSPAKGQPIYQSERQNLFVEKVLNKHFSGKTAEYLYSEMFKMNLATQNPTNIDVMYQHFKRRYPQSAYISWYDPYINDIAAKQSRGITNKMIFPAANGTKINTWEEVLALVKGKTVLVDMWGTWCSPCREELAENSAPLREYFKGKPVVFLYIDSFDMQNEKLWKKLIAYLNLEGMHILANNKLNKDIVSKLKFSGYPSYFLIKKDGTYKMTKTQYRVDRNAMIKEIEAAM